MLYDALVDERVLRYARQRAALLRRQARRPPALTQETIHALMIRAARRGKRVVRLKGGDPFVFGRGGEEALALAAAGIAVRGRAGRHERDRGAGARGHSGDASRPGVGLPRRVRARRARRSRPASSALAPNGVTLVVLMGLGEPRRLAATADRRAAGRATTPAAIVVRRVDAGRAGVARHARRAGANERAGTPAPGAPGTIVIGEVVRGRRRVLRRARRAAERVPDAARRG